MSIPIGPSVDEFTPAIIETAAMRAPDGSKGPSAGSDVFQSAADQALQADELVGKLGPAVGAYDAETENRLIQEY